MRKQILSILLALTLLLPVVLVTYAAQQIADQSTDLPSAGVGLVSDEHIAYIKGNGAGCFQPDNGISRAEAAVILYRLLDQRVPVTVSYTDVPTDSWYYDAVVQLGSLGVIRPNETIFQGSDQLTRGEFVRYLACFFPLRADAQQFSDVAPDDINAAAIISARAYGWLEGYGDGRVGPNDILSRCQAVALINRVLGLV